MAILSASLFLLVLGSPGLAQDKLELLGAGRMETIRRDGEPVRRLVQDVHLRRGTTNLTCDIAEYFVDRDEALLTGHVEITTPDSRLLADRVQYRGGDELLELTGNTDYTHSGYHVTAERQEYRLDLKQLLSTGNPVLVDSSSRLVADTVYYYEADSLGDARGNAFLENEADSLTVAADHLLYFAGKDSLKGDGNTLLVKFNNGTDTLFTIASDSIALESDFFFAWSDVELVHGNTLGTCDRATYRQEEDLAIMEGDPVLQEEEFTLEGDQFNLHLKDGELQSVFIPAKPRFHQIRTAADSSFEDWLTGRQMAVQFQEGSAREVDVVGMATSYFNVIEEQRYEGANRASGDTLFILLTDSSLSHITVSGGAEGVYTPAPGTDVDGPVRYRSEWIEYDIDQEQTLLRQNAEVTYLDMRLKAGHIGVYWRLNLLQARAMEDTVGAPDYPVLSQTGEEPFHGRTMVYNLQTQRGKVTAGRTRLEEGNYFGENLMRVNQDVYFMEEGYYTTCDLEQDPHFYFASNHMKLITDKLIVARPVVLYIADIPVLALPFAVFPQKKGRTSGFIMPAYDYRPGLGGRALKGLGYYWAMSDYSDFKVLMDYWDQYEELSYEARLRYNRRYRYAGNINFSMASRRTDLLDPKTWGWKLRFSHRQTINPSFRINASGQLNGDARFDRTYSHDQDTRLQTKLHSGFNLTKKFDRMGSLTMNGTYDQDLQVTSRLDKAPDNANEVLLGPTLALPSLSYRLPTRPLSKEESNPFHNLRLDYSNRFNNSRKWTYRAAEDPDSLLSGDTLKWATETENRHLFSQDLRLGGDVPLFKVFKINSNISYSEKWVFRYEEAQLDSLGHVRLDADGEILRKERSGFLRRGTFNTSASFNTKLYGVFPVRIGALQAIRHTLTPRMTLTYTPDFSRSFWGYLQSYVDSSGNSREYDPYRYTAIGATPTRSAMRMSYSLNNDFDYKLFKAGEEDPVKDRFITLTTSGSYDFRKDSLRASDINNSLQLRLSRKLKLNFRGTFEIYERDSTGRRLDQFRTPRLSRGSVTFQFRLAGHQQTQDQSAVDTTELLTADTTDLLMPDVLQAGPSPGKEVWGANLSFNYSHTQSNPYLEPVQRFQMNTTLNMKVSPNWKISYRGSYDLLHQKLVSHTLNLGRDLHCWKLSFNWTPSGGYRGFTLLIRPKASQLQDLKVEHKSRRRFLP